MTIPLIDFSSDQNPSAAINNALKDIGFMMVKNIGVDQHLLSKVYAASKGFFNCSIEDKNKYRYRSALENFGYQGLNEENLDPKAPSDLKETFTMRNVLNSGLGTERWPSEDFRTLMEQFFENVFNAGLSLQRCLAEALELPEDFFTKLHSGENCSLRLLYYPHSGVDRLTQSQMGAGAHTDYGLLTLLFQDHVGGLQVKDKNDEWADVTPIEEAIVVNSGDMLERWSNDRFKSTVHRVQPKLGHQERLSIAMFFDPDSDTEISTLPSCVSAANPQRYASILAGEHLRQKLEASHKDRFRK